MRWGQKIDYFPLIERWKEKWFAQGHSANECWDLAWSPVPMIPAPVLNLGNPVVPNSWHHLRSGSSSAKQADLPLKRGASQRVWAHCMAVVFLLRKAYRCTDHRTTKQQCLTSIQLDRPGSYKPFVVTMTTQTEVCYTCQSHKSIKKLRV